MRVLFLENHPIWIHGLPNGFKDAGHEVKISGQLTSDNIYPIISEFKPDLIITLGWTPVQLQLSIKKFIQLLNIPHVFWTTEDPGFTYTFSLPYIFAAQPDFVFTISKLRVDYYKKLGIKAAHLDFGYHSSVHYPVEHEERNKDSIAVVANAYPWLFNEYPQHFRNKSLKTLILPLLEEGFRIDFYGRNWREMNELLGNIIPQEWIHGYIPYTEANKIYSSNEILIGVLNHPTQLTQRIYEILGSGGLILTNDTPEIRRLFTPDRDILVSSSFNETVSLVKYYLNHPEESKIIRKNGRGTGEQHSYQRRAEYIIDILEEEGIFESNRSRYNSMRIAHALRERLINKNYIVCDGDTLFSLSLKFGVSIDHIRKLNKLSTDTLLVGQNLKIRD